jgi:type III secretion system FlhB-like substrate exporter
LKKEAPESELQKSLQKAFAVEYQREDTLPRVVASGAGEVAKKILALAQESGVPIVENKELSQLLEQSSLPSAKPQQALSEKGLQLLAEVLCYLFLVDEQWRKSHEFLGRHFESS